MSFHASVPRSMFEARRPVQADIPSMPSTDPLTLRQLRHHTKNALQGLIAQIDQAVELQETEVGRRLAGELQHRILLSARVSDALFGFTAAPGALEARLRSLCEDVAGLLGEAGQDIRTEVTIGGTCPGDLHEAILRSVHELVGNAVKHGLHKRTGGLIRVRLEQAGAATILTVRNDGWGFEPANDDGQGLEIVRELIAGHGGTLRLHRDGDATVAILTFPGSRSGALFS